MNKLTILALVAFGCAVSGEPEAGETVAIADVDQALTGCAEPRGVHWMFGGATVMLIGGSDPSQCSAAYYPGEPTGWDIGFNGAPPKRNDGKGSCEWLTPWSWTWQSCSIFRRFRCQFDPVTGGTFTYDAWVTATTQDWWDARLQMNVTTPPHGGVQVTCKKLVTARFVIP
jgi:hypothetical protein